MALTTAPAPFPGGPFAFSNGDTVEASVTRSSSSNDERVGAQADWVGIVPDFGVTTINAHTVIGQVTSGGSSVIVTLDGADVFTHAGSFACGVTVDGDTSREVSYDSGSQFTVSSIGSGDLVAFVCVGD